MHKNTEYFSLVLLPLFRHCQFVLDSNSFFSIFGWIYSSLLKLSYSFRFVIYQINAINYFSFFQNKINFDFTSQNCFLFFILRLSSF